METPRKDVEERVSELQETLNCLIKSQSLHNDTWKKLCAEQLGYKMSLKECNNKMKKLEAVLQEDRDKISKCETSLNQLKGASEKKPEDK
jgi:uncharacterized coiled-coil DUF342 family protein